MGGVEAEGADQSGRNGIVCSKDELLCWKYRRERELLISLQNKSQARKVRPAMQPCPVIDTHPSDVSPPQNMLMSKSPADEAFFLCLVDPTHPVLQRTRRASKLQNY